MVRKKDGSIRFCIDFRQLNSATRFDSYPLPRVNEVLDTLSGSKIFSTLDLKSGYQQIEIYPPDMHKTAFITQFGLYKWKVMPMGAKTSEANFQSLMDTIMTGLSWKKSVLVDLDDLVVFAKNYEKQQRLANANLKLSPKKCHFLQRKIQYLGHIIEDGKVAPDPQKTKIIDNYQVPNNIKEVRSFVSLASF